MEKQPTKMVTKHASVTGIVIALILIIPLCWTIIAPIVGLVVLGMSLSSVEKYHCGECGAKSVREAKKCPNCGEFRNSPKG